MHTVLIILGVLALILLGIFVLICVSGRGETVMSNRYLLLSLTSLPIMHLLITNDTWHDPEALKLGNVLVPGSMAQDLVIWVGVLFLVFLLLCLRKKEIPLSPRWR